MTRYFALAINAAGSLPKAKSQTTYKPKRVFHVENWGMAVSAALFVLGIVYLFQANSLSTKGYEIKNLEQQVVNLKETNERLELEARSLKSIESIQAQAHLLNFVPSGKVDYMQTETSVSYQR